MSDLKLDNRICVECERKGRSCWGIQMSPDERLSRCPFSAKHVKAQKLRAKNEFKESREKYRCADCAHFGTGGCQEANSRAGEAVRATSCICSSFSLRAQSPSPENPEVVRISVTPESGMALQWTDQQGDHEYPIVKQDSAEKLKTLNEVLKVFLGGVNLPSSYLLGACGVLVQDEMPPRPPQPGDEVTVILEDAEGIEAFFDKGVTYLATITEDEDYYSVLDNAGERHTLASLRLRIVQEDDND